MFISPYLSSAYITYQLKNKWHKCEGLGLNVFHFEWMVLTQEKLKKIKIVWTILDLPTSQHSQLGLYWVNLAWIYYAD